MKNTETNCLGSFIGETLASIDYTSDSECILTFVSGKILRIGVEVEYQWGSRDTSVEVAVLTYESHGG
jgi:hypothetical protein